MTFSPLEFVALQRCARDTNPSGPVHRLQGWLNLHGYACAVDGDFGPETEESFEAWRTRHMGAHWIRGPLTEVEWQILTAPLARAMALPVEVGPHIALGSPIGIGQAIVYSARQWLAQSVGGGPLRELPGNSGPVVEACTRWLAERDNLNCYCGHSLEMHPATQGLKCRHGHYRKGSEPCQCVKYKSDWRLAWCAGWVSTVLRQACESLGVPMPIKGSLSCDELARQGSEAGLFARCPPSTVPPPHEFVKPGDLFLVRGAKPGDWTHCGVVLEVRTGQNGQALAIRTAEGNTNAGGSRNGELLMEHVRVASEVDYLCWRSA